MDLDGDREGLALGDAEYRMFCDFVRRHCGLHFDADSRYLIEKRLARRIRELGLGSFAAYHHLIRRDAGGDRELDELVDEITTNETYFFRESRQLQALVQEILPELHLQKRARGGGPVSIWSAGCSSGEEPYSVVMLAIEAGYEPGKDLRVYASDISRRMLQKARQGVYRPASFRSTDPWLRRRYFSEKDGLGRVAEEVKRHVVFTHLNLLDHHRMALLGTMDVILCRNVIIYFDLETKRRVMEAFAEKLRPGGYLLLGHSESLVQVSRDFELRHLKNDLVYRRPVAGEGRGDLWDRAAAAAVADVAETPE